MGRPVTPSIAGQTSLHKIEIVFSSTGKVPNRNKNNSSIKPNKFHSKYVCFGGRKTRDERKLCLKIHLFGFPQRLVTGQSTTETRKMVSPSTLIGPFEFDRALATRPLLTCDRAVNKGRVASARSNSNGPIRVEGETILRVSVVDCPVTSL